MVSKLSLMKIINNANSSDRIFKNKVTFSPHSSLPQFNSLELS